MWLVVKEHDANSAQDGSPGAQDAARARCNYITTRGSLAETERDRLIERERERAREREKGIEREWIEESGETRRIEVYDALGTGFSTVLISTVCHESVASTAVYSFYFTPSAP